MAAASIYVRCATASATTTNSCFRRSKTAKPFTIRSNSSWAKENSHVDGHLYSAAREPGSHPKANGRLRPRARPGFLSHDLRSHRSRSAQRDCGLRRFFDALSALALWHGVRTTGQRLHLRPAKDL